MLSEQIHLWILALPTCVYHNRYKSVHKNLPPKLIGQERQKFFSICKVTKSSLKSA